MKILRMKRNYSNLILALIAMLVLVGCSNSSPTSSSPAKQTAEDVVKDFANAGANQDGDKVLKLLLDPDKYAEKLKGLSKTNKKQTVEFSKIAARNQDVALNKYVIVDFQEQGQQSTEQIYLKNTDQGFKVDISHTKGAGSQSFAQFKAEKPTTGVKFYIWAKLDDYFNYEFRGKDNQYYSLEVTDNANKFTSLYAYLSKDDSISTEVFDVLKDGKSHRMVVNLKYPTQRQNSSDGVLVDKVFTIDDWLDVPSSERADGK